MEGMEYLPHIALTGAAVRVANLNSMNTLLRDAFVIVEKARKSVDRQNEVSTAIETEFSRFSDDINQKFNELYNRICKIKKDYKHRIEFLESMCQHYTENLPHRKSVFAFDEIEIRQKLNKLEWDLIFLQCVGRSLIQASSSYLSEINFDNIEQMLHKTKKHLTTIDNILTNNYNVSVAYGLTLSPVPAFAPRKSSDNNKFTEVLQLVYNSMENLQRLPCTMEGMIDEEYMDQSSLMDEATKLLTMCIHIQQKIVNAESISTSERNSITSSTQEASLAENIVTPS
ncbi:hypothetical protein ACH3XW_9845 [Acanthocheilonema viteae]